MIDIERLEMFPPSPVFGKGDRLTKESPPGTYLVIQYEMPEDSVYVQGSRTKQVIDNRTQYHYWAPGEWSTDGTNLNLFPGELNRLPETASTFRGTYNPYQKITNKTGIGSRVGPNAAIVSNAGPGRRRVAPWDALPDNRMFWQLDDAGDLSFHTGDYAPNNAYRNGTLARLETELQISFITIDPSYVDGYSATEFLPKNIARLFIGRNDDTGLLDGEVIEQIIAALLEDFEIEDHEESSPYGHLPRYQGPVTLPLGRYRIPPNPIAEIREDPKKASEFRLIKSERSCPRDPRLVDIRSEIGALEQTKERTNNNLVTQQGNLDYYLGEQRRITRDVNLTQSVVDNTKAVLVAIDEKILAKNKICEDILVSAGPQELYTELNIYLGNLGLKYLRQDSNGAYGDRHYFETLYPFVMHDVSGRVPDKIAGPWYVRVGRGSIELTAKPNGIYWMSDAGVHRVHPHCPGGGDHWQACCVGEISASLEVSVREKDMYNVGMLIGAYLRSFWSVDTYGRTAREFITFSQVSIDINHPWATKIPGIKTTGILIPTVVPLEVLDGEDEETDEVSSGDFVSEQSLD